MHGGYSGMRRLTLMVFNTTTKASMDAFSGVPATGIAPTIGERTLRPSRMTLLALCIAEPSWRVKVSRWPGRSDYLFTVTGVRHIEAGTVETTAALECFGVRSLLNRFRMRMGMTLPRIPIMWERSDQWSRKMSKEQCARISKNGSKAASWKAPGYSVTEENRIK